MYCLLPIKKNSPTNYWKSVKISKRLLKNSEIAEVPTDYSDPRPHATVEICEESLVGLLDSGASISCLGRGADNFVQKYNLKVKSIKTVVNTADGAPQSVNGYADVPITYMNVTKLVRLYIVPSLTQILYLGVDFWKLFGIWPTCIESLDATPPILNTSDRMHNLNVDQQRQLQEAVDLLPSSESEGLGRTDILCHVINTNDAQPVKQRHYPISPAVQKEMYSEIDRMLALGVIEESSSPWNSPMVMVRKHCGKARLCLDSRVVNSVSVKDAYPLPIIDGILSRLDETFFISSVDLKDAFWQIPLDESSREKTAFTIPGRPHYQFARMPFGLCNAAQTMCRLMDRVIGPELRDYVFVYIDDLMIVSADFPTHIRRLRAVAERLRAANLTINVNKSKFVMREIDYLGYIVGNGCLKTNPEKVRAIAEFPRPRTIRQLRRFLGLTGWYQRFISNYSSISAPLTDLKGTADKFQWNEKAEAAFENLKGQLMSAPVLSHPDFSRPFIIQCDASATGVGGVLCQVGSDGEEHPIAFMSKKLNGAQKNYSVTELECYAAVLSVKKFRPYVEGMEFKVITDHASLKWLMHQKDLSGRLARWSLKLQCFNFAIEHRKGSLNIVPDALSRAHIEELTNESLSVDLNAVEFKSDDYLALVEKVIANGERLPDLMVVDNLVYIRTEPNRSQNVADRSCWKIWIPSELTSNLISQAHDTPLAAHGGVVKTMDRLKRLFYWPAMAVEVRRYIANCSLCKETKAPNVTLRPPMGQQVVVECPWQRIFIDLLGPYPRSKAGNVTLIIVLDQFSKFVLLKPIRKADASTIIRFLEAEVFHMFGVPEEVLSDNGVQFLSKDFKLFLKQHGINHMTTATHSPQANASERVNRSILAAVRTYIGENHQNWDVHISAIASALRNSVHESIGYSPYFVMFGRQQVQHGSAYALIKNLNGLPMPNTVALPPSDFQDILRQQIQDRLQRAHDKHEAVYNTRSKFVSYVPGQELYRRNFTQSDFAKNYNAKLAKKFLKCRVVRKIGTAMYELEDLQGAPISMRYHAKDLRP